MTLIKKTLLSVAAIAVMTGISSCGGDEVAPKPNGNTDNTDTTAGATLTAIGGWSDIMDSGIVTLTSGTNDKDSSFDASLTRQQAVEATDFWPSAAVVAGVTTGNFEGLTKVEIKYTVKKMTSTADGVAFYLGASTDAGVELGGDKYGAFRAVLTSGKEALNTEVTDTLSLADFYLDWGYDDDAAMATAQYEVTTVGTEKQCTLDKNPQVLEMCGGVAFTLENDNTTGPDTLELSVKSVKFVGVTPTF